MFSMPDVAVILAIVLILFGPGKLPDIGSALGKGLKSLRQAREEENAPAKAAKSDKLANAKAEGVATKTSSSEQPSAGQ
jgi:sec-independent protein translocase protein TatA